MNPSYVRNKLDGANSPAERAALVHLIQECNEVAVEATKALLYGLSNWHPDDPLRVNNLNRIDRELRDLALAVTRLENVLKRHRRPS